MKINPEEAKRLLESPIFIFAMDEWKNYCIDRIKLNPLDCDEETIGLSMLDKLVSFIKSAEFEEKLQHYNKEQLKKYT